MKRRQKLVPPSIEEYGNDYFAEWTVWHMRNNADSRTVKRGNLLVLSTR